MQLNTYPVSHYKEKDRVFDLITMKPSYVDHIKLDTVNPDESYIAVFSFDWSRKKYVGYKRKSMDIIPIEVLLDKIIQLGAENITKEAFYGKTD